MITPQQFPAGALTQLPAKDFIADLKTQLPSVYQNMPSFMGIMTAIATQKQQYYDIIRSLVNAVNYNSVNSTTIPSGSSGDYLKIMANYLTQTYSSTASDSTLRSAIANRIVFVTSRGTIRDFYNYYVANGYGSQFTNALFQESGNASLNVTIALDPTTPAYTQFVYDLFKLKAIGIQLTVNSSVIKYYQLGKPDQSVSADGAGLSYLDPRNNPVAGGFYKTTTT
jgi:hypothetical protein